jgi:hypothetical protein
MTCALLLIILAQIAESVELGEDRVNVFTLGDGSRLYGVIAADMDRVVRIYLDEPWKSESQRTTTINKREIASQVVETRDARLQRLKEGWEQRGYTLVRTGNGWVRVEKAQADLAARAAEMAAAANSPPAPPLSETVARLAVSADTLAPETEEGAPPRSPARYALVAGIGIVALALIAVIGKTMVLG